MKPTSNQPQPLLRANGTSLHHQIFLALREQILRGDFPPEGMIPTEGEIGMQFGVSRITVRRAMADLEAEGLVERRQGRGTFVRADLPVTRPAATLGLVDSLQLVSNETEVAVIEIEIGSPSREIGLQLQLRDGEPATKVIRLRTIEGTPVMLTEAWIPKIDGLQISQTTLQAQPLFQLLMDRGIEFGRVVQEITAISAEANHALRLHVGLGQPLIKLTRLLYDVDKRPVLHLVLIVSPERSRMIMDVSANDINSLATGHIFHDRCKPLNP